METELQEENWTQLLHNIYEGRCVAFVGSGINVNVLPFATFIAKDYEIPLKYADNPFRTASFLVGRQYGYGVSDLVYRWTQEMTTPDFTAPDVPHSILAELPLSIYITTNYDDCLEQALKSRNRAPKTELCRWKKSLKEYTPSIFEAEPKFKPASGTPVVFHLFGHVHEPESLVVTEEDFLDFLKNFFAEPNVLPLEIQKALTVTSLLFMGFSEEDLTYRMLLRFLVASTDRTPRFINLTHQEPTNDESYNMKPELMKFIEQYFYNTNTRVFWGDITSFSNELRKRWKDFADTNIPSPGNFAGGLKTDETVKSKVQIFLSYAREDEIMVRDLYHQLSNAGFRAWMDKFDILPGEQWSSSIKRAIRDSDFFIACLSNTSVKKRSYIQKELRDALDIWQEKLESDIYLIPARLDNCDLPDNLSNFQCVNLYEETGFANLVYAIQTGIKRRSD